MKFIAVVPRRVLTFLLFVLATGVVQGGELDIRVNGPLSSGQSSISYTASVGQCDSAVSIQAGTDGNMKEYASQDVRTDLSQPSACLLDFDVSGGSKFQPRIEVLRSSGESDSHSELFSHESNEPELSLQGVDVSTTDGNQYLVVNLQASDDTDITYIGVNVAGVRASDIRSAGGVLNDARKNSYAKTDGIHRVYPRADSQGAYSLSLQVNDPLSRAAISSDAVVLIDAFAVDSSGNQVAISDIAYTGGSIQEDALSLSLSTDEITINNSLQTPVLRPSVEYEFRGMVDMSGPGRGIEYTSSHPEFVAVTKSGVLYPLAETEGTAVTVEITYRDLPPVNIPVVVDFSKRLVALEFEGASDQGLVEFDGLNTFHDLPSLVGVFDDGTTTELSSSWTPTVEIPDSYHGILSRNSKGALRASSVIPSTSAAPLKVVGFYPVTADIPKKRHTVPKECSCPDAENIAQSSNAKPSL